MEKLQVELGSVVSGLDVSLELPTIIQTSGLPQDDALAFVKDCADGKRKIAKAVRNKYEGTSGTASEITEYSTFDELSNKISQIPVEVPLGSAMEQNGGVLPFYDVYNETLKAMKEFAGYGFNGVCAFELDKSDDYIILGGADAYYISGDKELFDGGKYVFKDWGRGNTNRCVVCFYNDAQYNINSVITSFTPNSVLNIYCVKGTPTMSFNAVYVRLHSVNVYDGELTTNNVTIFKSLSNVYEVNLYHITSIANTQKFIDTNPLLKIISLPNLKEIGANSNYIINGNSNLVVLDVPNLTKVHRGGFLATSNSSLRHIYLPKLYSCEHGIFFANLSFLRTIILGDGTNNGEAGDILINGNHSSIDTTLTTLTVAEGFKAKLNLTGCNGLERDVLVDILNNLADLTGETSLNLIMGATLLAKLTDADKAIATQKNWTLS